MARIKEKELNIGDKVSFDNGLVKGKNAIISEVRHNEYLKTITGFGTRYVVEYNNTHHICRPDEVTKMKEG